jgi:hypothetical protein
VSFEAFTAVMLQVEFLWVVTPCSVVVGYPDTSFEAFTAVMFQVEGLLGCDTVYHNIYTMSQPRRPLDLFQEVVSPKFVVHACTLEIKLLKNFM